MRHITNKTGWLCRILLALFFAASCSQRAASPGSSALDNAILLYISGRYTEARDELTDLTRTLETDSDRGIAYLYLARSLEALGDYAAARDALATGMMVSGDIPFYDYLQQMRSRSEADPEFALRHASLSRAQLACLIDGWIDRRAFGRGIGSGDAPSASSENLPADVSGHWAKGSIERMISAGIMKTLPDLLFHPEEKVTRASFFFIVRRLQVMLSLDEDALEGLFPGGLDRILHEQLATNGEEAKQVYLSGKEAVTVLDKLSLPINDPDD